MLRLSLSTLHHKRWLFAGAVLTVALAVALVQSSLQVMGATAFVQPMPGVGQAEAERIRGMLDGAAVLMGMTVMLAGFLGVFIVGSTFAFTVAQRRRELALLRLVGGGRGQLRLLLLAEAFLLGLAGTMLGVPLGLLATGVQAELLTVLGMLPDDYPMRWDGRVLWVSAMIGIGTSMVGAFSAARRAGSVQPLEALRDSGSAARVMTPGRWFFGLCLLGGTLGMLALAQRVELAGALAISLMVAISGSAALSVLSPLVVPPVGYLLGLLLRANVIGQLAEANLRDGVRRSASTAAPLIVLTGLLLGLSGTLESLATMGETEQRQVLAADLVVGSTGEAATRLGGVPGVAAVSAEEEVPARIELIHREEAHSWTQVFNSGMFAVDPAGYQRTHRLAPRAGSLDELHGATIAAGPALAGEGIRVGDTLRVTFEGAEREVRVVALMPETVAEGATFLLSRDAVPAELLARSPARSMVQLAPGADPAAVAASIQAAGLGEVRSLAQWIADDTVQQQRDNNAVLTALMGLATVFCAVAVVNSVAIAGAERSVEFAAARVTGLSRTQVVLMALTESWAVTVIALGLGLATMAGVLIGLPVPAVPWSLLGWLALGAFTVVGLTATCSALAATRHPPVTLITARE